MGGNPRDRIRLTDPPRKLFRVFGERPTWIFGAPHQPSQIILQRAALQLCLAYRIICRLQGIGCSMMRMADHMG